MAIDYYTCTYCGVAFPDCSSQYRSCEMCGESYCSSQCASLKKIEVDEVDEDSEQLVQSDYIDQYNCRMCRREDVSASTLLSFLLKHFKLSYDDALKLWQNEDDTDNGE